MLVKLKIHLATSLNLLFTNVGSQLPGGVKLVVLGSCHQLWVNTYMFKHRLKKAGWESFSITTSDHQ